MKARITPEVLEVWQRLRAINRVKRWRERWEDEGGRRREFLDGEKRLATLLGLWWGDYVLPLDATAAEPPDYMRGNSDHSEQWRVAWAWRCAMIEATKEQRRAGKAARKLAAKDAAAKDAAAKGAVA
jgi:hypothetical protein